MKMFSDNNRISGRQAFRLLTYDLLGLGTLLVPTALAQTAGRDGIFCIGIAVVAALWYLKILSGVAADMEQGNHTSERGTGREDFAGYLERRCGVFCGKLLKLGYVIYFVLLAGYVAYQFTVIILKNLLREEAFWLVLLILLLLATYGLSGGLEGRARVYELLFWFVMAPLLLMLFSALDEICVDYWTPVFTGSLSGIWRGSYAMFVWFAPVFLVVFLGSFVEKRQALFRAGRAALLFSGILYAVLYLILLGIFGAGALASMDTPVITMMSTVKITGGFLKRTDAFMLGIWFFTLYALLSSAAFYGGGMLQSLVTGQRGGRRTSGEKSWAGYLVLAAAFVLAEIFYRSEEACEYFHIFFSCVGTPFVVAVPVLLWLLRGKEGRKMKIQDESEVQG